MATLLLPIGVTVGMVFMWWLLRKWPEEMYRDGYWDGAHGMPSLYPEPRPDTGPRDDTGRGET